MSQRNLLAKLCLVLLTLGIAGPLVGKAELGATLAVSILLTGLLFLVDQLILPRVLTIIPNSLAAAGDGLLAAAFIRLAGPLLGAQFPLIAAMFLGLILAAGEPILHRWAGLARVESRRY